MADSTSSPAQANPITTFFNLVFNLLVTSGEDAAQSAATAQAPILGFPFVKEIFRDILNQAKIVLDRVVLERADQVIIYAQKKWEQAGFDKATAQFKITESNLNASLAEKQKAYEALEQAFYKVVEQNKAATNGET